MIYKGRDTYRRWREPVDVWECHGGSRAARSLRRKGSPIVGYHAACSKAPRAASLKARRGRYLKGSGSQDVRDSLEIFSRPAIRSALPMDNELQIQLSAKSIDALPWGQASFPIGDGKPPHAAALPTIR